MTFNHKFLIGQSGTKVRQVWFQTLSAAGHSFQSYPTQKLKRKLTQGGAWAQSFSLSRTGSGGPSEDLGEDGLKTTGLDSL